MGVADTEVVVATQDEAISVVQDRPPSHGAAVDERQALAAGLQCQATLPILDRAGTRRSIVSLQQMTSTPSFDPRCQLGGGPRNTYTSLPATPRRTMFHLSHSAVGVRALVISMTTTRHGAGYSTLRHRDANRSHRATRYSSSTPRGTSCPHHIHEPDWLEGWRRCWRRGVAKQVRRRAPKKGDPPR